MRPHTFIDDPLGYQLYSRSFLFPRGPVSPSSSFCPGLFWYTRESAVASATSVIPLVLETFPMNFSTVCQFCSLSNISWTMFCGLSRAPSSIFAFSCVRMSQFMSVCSAWMPRCASRARYHAPRSIVVVTLRGRKTTERGMATFFRHQPARTELGCITLLHGDCEMFLVEPRSPWVAPFSVRLIAYSEPGTSVISSSAVLLS